MPRTTKNSPSYTPHSKNSGNNTPQMTGKSKSRSAATDRRQGPNKDNFSEASPTPSIRQNLHIDELRSSSVEDLEIEKIGKTPQSQKQGKHHRNPIPHDNREESTQPERAQHRQANQAKQQRRPTGTLEDYSSPNEEEDDDSVEELYEDSHRTVKLANLKVCPPG